MVEERSILKIYVLGILTCGIYFLYWFWKSKQDINELGGDIPPAWMLLIPIANIYWLYRYAEAFSKYVKGDDNTVLWFLLFWFVTIITPAVVQSELNKIARNQNI
jgi:hypothetical protein